MSIKRNPDESFADFKERRISDNEQTRLALKPKMFHNSYYEGIYINKERNTEKALKKQMGARQYKKFVKAQREGNV